MSAFNLKLVAVATMVADHLGAFFFPEVIWLRVVGRLSFPLFGWLVANGARHTRDVGGYLRRLVIFAVVAQAPFVLARRLAEPGFWELNILFSLALGLVAILVTRGGYGWGVKAAGMAGICAMAVLLRVEYGVVGVLSIVASYIFFSRWAELIFWQILIFTAPLLMPGVLEAGSYGNIQILAPSAFVLVYFYSGKQGPRGKYWFYAFYPVQFVIIYLLKRMGV